MMGLSSSPSVTAQSSTISRRLVGDAPFARHVTDKNVSNLIFPEPTGVRQLKLNFLRTRSRGSILLFFMPRLPINPGPVTLSTQGTFRVFFKFSSIFLQLKKIEEPIICSAKTKINRFPRGRATSSHVLLTRSAAQPWHAMSQFLRL